MDEKGKILKIHGELPGFERQTIPELDELGQRILGAEAAMKSAREAHKMLTELCMTRLEECESDGRIERDQYGDTSYVYRDGDRTVIMRLKRDEKLSVKAYDTPEDER